MSKTDIKALEYFQNHPEEKIYSDDKTQDRLLDNYNKLNTIGKEEAVKRVEELTEIKKYTE